MFRFRIWCFALSKPETEAIECIKRGKFRFREVDGIAHAQSHKISLMAASQKSGEKPLQFFWEKFTIPKELQIEFIELRGKIPKSQNSQKNEEN
ncbi:hypothetical protein KUTeg_022071 [Tegillarca granosa]|uniref:Uncharacterized protein n=1 Tax=Tegillarca granosa TaxID=220873 RepID=A0ABQ9EAG8_TEGGR|nr:hypothetical protein KUTeg_022071 [Tegillarca granosa]